MTTITLTDEQRDQLKAAGGVAELVDAAGQLLAVAKPALEQPTREELDAALAQPGRLSAAEVAARLIIESARRPGGALVVDEPDPTPEELARDLAAPGRLTTAEVVERLRGLAG